MVPPRQIYTVFTRWSTEYLAIKFDIHVAVHRKYISKLQPTRCNVVWFINFYRRSTLNTQRKASNV